MGSLRTRILATYALVAVLPLTLAGVVALGLFVRYERQAALARRGALLTAVTADLGDIAEAPREALSPEFLQRVRRQASALRGRLLVVDADGTVLLDTGFEGPLVGQALRLPAQTALRQASASPTWRRARLGDGQAYYLAAVPLQRAAAAEAGQPATRYLVLAVAAEDLGRAWREVLLAVSPAGLVGLGVAALVAFTLGRSITRPLRALTLATREVARGHYDARLPVQGSDELAEVAQGFNRMAGEVERARRTQRDFLANVTHDLRTPLTSIQGFSQALLEGTMEGADGARQAAAIIHEEAGRMRRLIDDLLELARLEADAGALSLESVDLAAWLPSLAQGLSARAEAAGLAFTCTPEPGPLAVRADPRRLEQAVANLVDNACKYTPAGGHVTLSAERVRVRRGRAEPPLSGRLVAGKEPLRDGPWAAIRVADTGRGIAPQDVGRVFERFYRADKAREATGSGLGLAIVREIVLAHGGLIAVESTPGQGTTMTVLLPASPGS